MNRTRKFLHPASFLAVLILASLACQTLAGGILLPQPPTPTATQPPAPPTSTVTPSPQPSPTPPPSPTPLPPTRTPRPTPTESPTPAIDQLQVFDEVWTTVRDNYLYQDFNGLDWDAVRQEYQGRIEAGMSDQEFYLAMDEMIASLGDDHSIFFSPQDAAIEDTQFEGEYQYVGIGVLTTTVPERQRVTIILVFPGSPADQAGLAPHDSILSADGQPILDESGFRRDLLRGPVGSRVVLSVQSPGGSPREVTLVRRTITGATPVPYQVLTSPARKRIGYLLLTTFEDKTVPEQVAAALGKMSAEAPLDGLIIDNRQNGGGADVVTSDVLRYFASGLLGHFVDRQGESSLRVLGEDIHSSLKIPLVVLVGKDTASFGEIFSGILQDIRRAYLIGEVTGGNVEILWIYDFSDGSRAWIAHSTFQPLNHPDADWEQSGIIPDQVVPSDWDQETLETDPAIKASLAHFDSTRSSSP